MSSAAHDLRQHVAIAVHACDVLDDADADPAIRRRALESLAACAAELHRAALELVAAASADHHAPSSSTEHADDG